MKQQTEIVIPAEAVEHSHIQPGEHIAIHVGENTLVVVPEKLTALQAANAIAHLTGANVFYVDALSIAAGGMLISFAAYLNGKRAKKLNPRHHMIRALIEALLVVGVILW